MRLILIRHAESLHQKAKLISSINSCRGLSEIGREQANLLAKRLSQTQEVNPCDAILTSPILRARQTAEILLKAIPVNDVFVMDDLVEMLPGDADGLDWDTYHSKFGGFDIPSEPDRPFAPGGESWSVFLNRVQRTLNSIADQYAGQSVLGVTHAGFIMATIHAMFAVPRPGTGAQIHPANTSLTEWRRIDGTWELHRLSDAAHLLYQGNA
jgi:probable phosphoglycerate mutase